MTELFRTTVEIRPGNGPAGLLAGEWMVNGTGVSMDRQGLTSITIRDPWRRLAVSRPVISALSLGWMLEMGDSDTFELLVDAIADPGRATDLAGVRRWEIGRAEEPTRWDFALMPVEGGDCELREAALKRLQVVVDRNALIGVSTEWVAREVGDLTAWDSTALANETLAGSLDVEVTIEGESLPVFAFALGISRDIAPAHFDLEGRARAWKGTLAPDAVGRVVTRLEANQAQSLAAGATVSREIVVSITAGARRRTITLPNALCEITRRELVGVGTYEHSVDFLITRETDGAAIIIESEDIP